MMTTKSETGSHVDPTIQKSRYRPVRDNLDLNVELHSII